MLKKWFPQITDSIAAKSLTKQGAGAVLIYAGMNIFGAVFTYFLSKSPVDARAFDSQQVLSQIIGNVMVSLLLLFFAYRVYKGKGWFAGGLTLVFFLIEIWFKIANGTTNIGWLLFYIAVTAMLINGIRGCWWMRKNQS